MAEEASRKLMAACAAGDVAALEALFLELEIDSEHPRTPYSFPNDMPDEQRLPSVSGMLTAAIQGQQLDLLKFLCGKFPGTTCFGAPMRAAIDTGSVAVLKMVSEFDRESTSVELGDDSLLNALAYAAMKPNGAQLVKTLLDAGANPNVTPPFRMFSNWNVSAAIMHGLPLATFQQFVDVGYSANDPYAIKLAVEHKRPDVFKLLYKHARSVDGAAPIPTKEELIEVARENKDGDMLVVIERAYAARGKGLVVIERAYAARGKGLVATILGKFRSRN